jgi:hypothetical protein
LAARIWRETAMFLSNVLLFEEKVAEVPQILALSYPNSVKCLNMIGAGMGLMLSL